VGIPLPPHHSLRLCLGGNGGGGGGAVLAMVMMVMMVKVPAV